jgi:hypothetical protein
MSMLKIAIRCFVRYVGIPELLVFVVAAMRRDVVLDTPHARSTLHRSPRAIPDVHVGVTVKAAAHPRSPIPPFAAPATAPRGGSPGTAAARGGVKDRPGSALTAATHGGHRERAQRARSVRACTTARAIRSAEGGDETRVPAGDCRAAAPGRRPRGYDSRYLARYSRLTKRTDGSALRSSQRIFVAARWTGALCAHLMCPSCHAHSSSSSSA